ncbi:hypothetical protein CN936_18695 [Bacillus cereus]|uniref:YrpD family protein n=1 Tax=Bacillus cereus group TaxID=86661 RepID=UPI0002E6A158|nr:YrpD family protein [Bacillus cereus]KMP50173.1 hypothetical protein TU59_23385 [Bacillus cereus]MDA2379469.1 YrpD family protein [Bacillus cereus]MEB9408550.1 YrpD family protein [Bacillus cereus]PEQ99466.1 hypothetical protein CN483_16290 [Bacillus cereus]PET48506.1 hypothetical protein CN521_20735 [Bacillus cereus]
MDKFRKIMGVALVSGMVISGLGGIGTTQANADEMRAHSYVKALQAEPIKKGIGGRSILNSTGSVLTTKVTLPEIKNNNGTLKAKGGELYIYSGFSGPVESDIGFLYSETYNVWKPYMKVGGNKEPIYIEGKDEFTNLNGFKPGTEVQLTIYKNLNGNTRATYWGTNGKGYTGRLISEIKNTNISKVNNWKALSTIAVKDDSQTKNIKVNTQYRATFSDILIDNKPINPISNATEFAKIYTNNNKVSIDIIEKK